MFVNLIKTIVYRELFGRESVVRNLLAGRGSLGRSAEWVRVSHRRRAAGRHRAYKTERFPGPETKEQAEHASPRARAFD
jgi:hypothetical protein